MTSRAPELQVGSKIGRYECLQRLGYAAFGEFWVLRFFAEKRSVLALGRIIRMDPQWSPEFQESLSEAAWDSMEVQHDRVVRPADVVFEADLVLVVCDFVEGQSLRTLLQLKSEAGTALPVDVVLRLALDALAAVDGAHEGGDLLGSAFAYGGIAPDAFLVSTAGDTYFMDPLLGSALASAELSQANRVYYRAPEQGDAASDARGDVFAMGCMLWELLENRELSTDARSRAHGAPLPIPALDLKRRPSEELTPALAQIVAKATASSPKERFASSKQLARAIEGAKVPIADRKTVAAFVEFLASSRLHSQRQATESSTIASLATLLGPPRRGSDGGKPRPQTAAPAPAIAAPPPSEPKTNPKIPAPSEPKTSPKNLVPAAEPKSAPKNVAPPLDVKSAPRNVAPPLDVKSAPKNVAPPLDVKSAPRNLVPTPETKSAPKHAVPAREPRVAAKVAPPVEVKSAPLNAPPLNAPPAKGAAKSAPLNERPAPLNPIPTRSIEAKPAAAKPQAAAPKVLSAPNQSPKGAPGPISPEASAGMTAPKLGIRPKASTLLGLNTKDMVIPVPPAPVPAPPPAPLPAFESPTAAALPPPAPARPQAPPARNEPPGAAVLPALPPLAPAPAFGAISMLDLSSAPQKPAARTTLALGDKQPSEAADAGATEDDLRELSEFVGDRYSGYDGDFDDEPTRADLRREDLPRRGGTVMLDGPKAPVASPDPKDKPPPGALSPGGTMVLAPPGAVPTAAVPPAALSPGATMVLAPPGALPSPAGAPSAVAPPGAVSPGAASPGANMVWPAPAAPAQPLPGVPQVQHWGTSTMPLMPAGEQPTWPLPPQQPQALAPNQTVAYQPPGAAMPAGQPAAAPPAGGPYPGATLPLGAAWSGASNNPYQADPNNSYPAAQGVAYAAPVDAAVHPGPADNTPPPVERTAKKKGKVPVAVWLGAGAILAVVLVAVGFKVVSSSKAAPDTAENSPSPQDIAAALEGAPSEGATPEAAPSTPPAEEAKPAETAVVAAEPSAEASAAPTEPTPEPSVAVAPPEPAADEAEEAEKPAAPRAPRATKPSKKKKKRFVPSEL